MRESQKMSLDYKLHKKIIASITKIQRWFKTKLQREKFKSYRAAAIRIQACWRMHMARNRLYHLKLRTNAAILIQSTFRMFKQRRAYKKLLAGLVVVQARIRGRAARIRFGRIKNNQKKILKERYKLRNTQSLPINDRSVDGSTDVIDVDISRSYPKLIQYSLGYSSDNVNNTEMRKVSTTSEQDANLLHKAEHQFRSLMISTKGSGSSSSTNLDSPHADNLRTESQMKAKAITEDVDSRSSRSYNLDAASKQFYEEAHMKKR